MGWGDVISIGLGLGNAALNASNASTLQQMKLQRASEAIYREFINLLRNGMFNLKQTAEDVLAGEEASPLQAAGAMRILDYQLSASGVTPDLFPEISDKEYAAATSRLINSNSSRMYAALDDHGKKQVDELLVHLKRLPELQYYLEYADNLSRLQAGEAVSNVGNSTEKKGCLITFGLFIFSFVLALVNETLAMIAVYASLFIGFLFLMSLVSKWQSANPNKKKIKELESSIDLSRIKKLDEWFNTPDRAKQFQKESELYVENFFGDSTLLQNGWRT